MAQTCPNCKQGAGIFPDLFYSPIPQSMILRLFIPLVFTCLAFYLNGCASSAKSDHKDYTLAVGAAYPTEAKIAQDRVTKYLEHLKPDKKARIAENEYLAVESTEVPASQVPGFSNRITAHSGLYTNPRPQHPKFLLTFH